MGESEFEDLGPNSGLAEDMYGRYVEDPASVPDGWREFFDQREEAGPQPPRSPSPQPPSPAPQPSSAPPAAAPPVAETDGADRPVPMRGATARIVENMEASLGVPTATSVRTVPAKLLEVNRQILNNHLARTGGDKVSFTWELVDQDGSVLLEGSEFLEVGEDGKFSRVTSFAGRPAERPAFS